MNKTTEAGGLSKNLQWHPAFYAGLQIELSGEKEKLLFENEHQLGTKPKEIDVLVIKKQQGEKINKNIGGIFRTYNIVEYKSPTDWLSIDNYYKVYAYACLYKSDTGRENEILAEEITLTFACYRYPREVIDHLFGKLGQRVEKVAQGIYYIYGDHFPMQIIIIPQLSKKENLWLRNLNTGIDSQEDIEEIVADYDRHRKENLYESVMDLIVRANKEVFREDREMCEALEELFRECMGEEVEKKVKEQVEQKVREQEEQKVREQEEKDKISIINFFKYNASDEMIRDVLGCEQSLIDQVRLSIKEA